jgi:hypothetical protein
MTTITIQQLGDYYASPAARKRDGVAVVWRGIDQGNDERGEPLPIPPDARKPCGLNFARARVALRYHGQRVLSVEHAAGSWWVLVEWDACQVEAGAVLVWEQMVMAA